LASLEVQERLKELHENEKFEKMIQNNLNLLLSSFIKRYASKAVLCKYNIMVN